MPASFYEAPALKKAAAACSCSHSSFCEYSPIMKTERLHIRRFTANDWQDLFEYLSDLRVVQYEPYLPMTEAQCKEVAKQRAA